MTIDYTQLEGRIPAEWKIVPNNGKKQPINLDTGKGFKGWQNSNLKLEDIKASPKHVRAIGVRTGRASDGLLVIDIDSEKGRTLLEQIIGRPMSEIPKTIACTSGKPGTYKCFLRVRDQGSRNRLRTARLDGVDILWDGCQAVLTGEHPTTGSYKWEEGCSPSETSLADAPNWLVDALVEHLIASRRVGNVDILRVSKHSKKGSSSKTKIIGRQKETDIKLARKALQSIDPTKNERYEPWLKVGMCLHSVDSSLLENWIGWSSHMKNFDEQECRLKWASFSDCDTYFEKTGRQGLGIGTLLTMANSGQRERPISHDLATLLKDKEKIHMALLGFLRTWNIRLNELKRRVEIDGEILPYDPRYFYLHFADITGLSINRELARDALITVAQENAYNPIEEYLKSVLPLAEESAPVSDEELASWFGLNVLDSVSIGLLRVHLRACAVRGINPGSKMDSVLILSGSMGLRKSSVIKMLSPDESWYDETTRLDIDSKDTLSAMNSAWHFEFSEVEKITATRDSALLKAFVSRTVDKYVEKWESVVTEHPRRACLWGTTNSGSFLNDPTGSRRYWIAFVVKACDTEGLRVNRDRLWAHSLSEALQGLPYFLDPTDSLMIEASKRGSNATLTDPWQELLEGLLADKYKSGEFLSTQNLFALIDRGSPYNWDGGGERQTLDAHNLHDARRLANAMNALGWRSHRTKNSRGYIKP